MSARTRQWIRKLTRKFEFLIVILIAFGYPILGALISLFSESHKIIITGSSLKFLLVYEIVVLLALSCFLKKRGWSFKKMGLYPNLKSAIWGVMLVPCLYLIWVLIWMALTLLIPDFLLIVKHKTVAISGVSLWIIICVSVLNPLFEELFVCAYVISFLRKIKSLWFAVIISTGIRVLYHLYQPLSGIIFILCIGLAFGYCYARTNQLSSAIVAHAFFDFLPLVMGH